MTKKEILLDHLKKSADCHSAMAEEHTKLSKSHAAAAQEHTNAVLGQHSRDQSGHHARIAEQHSDHARHLLQVHQHVSGISSAELFPSHSDAADELRDSTGTADLLKRFCGREV